ncbi:ABC transporter ATP-binding protein [Paenibacillus sp. 32352]|uniref:ABC transporter ATP-binding protein n=1 Tax=Paenibacillus sp. 32352 TaxID=1969111 RepID=UPI0009AC2A57|nr:ABC transporter ATP-binding protein [Paenibacillus sp. 32352]
MISMAMHDISVQYNGRTVINKLNWHIDSGNIYSILGPNGCGKSTLLKSISSQLKVQTGFIHLDGKALNSITPRQLARQMAVLQQSQEKLPELTIKTLVGYGRFPHKPVWERLGKEDEAIIDWALAQTGTEAYAGRKLASLSGGERQRVWIAMALAQQPGILLLDEPTTYLDVSHQLEIMELIKEINRSYGVTIIMVLHDINHAAAFSDEIAVMKQGGLYASGTPEEVITASMLADVFGVRARMDWDSESGRPSCLITGLVEKKAPDRNREELFQPFSRS